ncbi:hypothetical protein MAM1_0201c07890 [Mucor ambiguus]|uniref:Uncharacterized protein n=1 Tax=Mucor ambiguus TaxID=91626 RepID=A0A0C9MCN5_9FUNG|nr:hypothetical protein MAM1_0201c07890 [Mucor ambiguus]
MKLIPEESALDSSRTVLHISRWTHALKYLTRRLEAKHSQYEQDNKVLDAYTSDCLDVEAAFGSSNLADIAACYSQ